MLIEEFGDLVKDEKYNIICHQANCKGVLGAGIARQIVLEYPVVWHRNKDYCSKRDPLGTILPVRIGPNRICVNLYGQRDFGREYKRYTDYDALQKALDDLAVRLDKVPSTMTVGFPWHMSCGLAGGSWTKVYAMLEDFASKVKQNVYIVRLNTERK